jgi:hypothetical protein
MSKIEREVRDGLTAGDYAVTGFGFLRLIERQAASAFDEIGPHVAAGQNVEFRGGSADDDGTGGARVDGDAGWAFAGSPIVSLTSHDQEQRSEKGPMNSH